MSIKDETVDAILMHYPGEEKNLFSRSNIANLNFDDLKLNIINLKRGKVLFRQGDSADSIYLIIEGEINLFKKHDVKEPYTFFTANDFVGLEEYFQKTKRNSLAIALQDSRIAKLSKEDIEILITRHNSIINNDENSTSDSDPITVSEFESIDQLTSNHFEEPSSVVPIQPQTEESASPIPETVKEEFSVAEENVPSPKIIEPPKGQIIKDINGYFLLLQTETNKLQTEILEYEHKKQTLIKELEALEDQKKKYDRLNIGQNEILAGQGDKNVELKKKTEKYDELAAEYLKNIENFTEESLKDKNIIKELESELKETQKILAELRAVRLQPIKEADTKDLVINELKTELENLAQKNKSLNNELALKEKGILELHQELQNKNHLISQQNNNEDLKKDIEELRSTLKRKNDQITELDNLFKQTESSLEEKNLLEKQQAEIIESQLQRISQLEVLLNESISKSKDSLILKEENVFSGSAFITDTGKPCVSLENDEIFSKAELIASKRVNSFVATESFEHFKYNDVQIINVKLTRVTMDVVTIFSELLKEVIGTEKKKIVVNLSECEFIDSSILGVLVSSVKKATSLDGDLRLAGLRPAVHSMMELTRMHRIFESHPTLGDAIASFD